MIQYEYFAIFFHLEHTFNLRKYVENLQNSSAVNSFYFSLIFMRGKVKWCAACGSEEMVRVRGRDNKLTNV